VHMKSTFLFGGYGPTTGPNKEPGTNPGAAIRQGQWKQTQGGTVGHRHTQGTHSAICTGARA
jgi:hypothetical protein